VGSLLRSTFCHVPGVGPWTEAELWRLGITDWSTFLQRPSLPGISAGRKTRWNDELRRSEAALTERSAEWFADRLPALEHWRLYPEFRDETAFLDIETTSLSPFGGIVTVVTVHGGGATRTFVADEDLAELPAYLRRFHVLATFNGIFFDVPFLRVAFPHWVPPRAHIDLRFVLRRLGYVGGLKRIEQQLNLGDRAGVEGIHGIDAVRLWQRWRRGERAALELLIDYNRADTVNLEPLLEYAVGELERRVGPVERRGRLDAFAGLTPERRPPIGSVAPAPPGAPPTGGGASPPTSG
jgi:uncharacterized protein